MVGLNCSGEYIDFTNGVLHSHRCTYLKQNFLVTMFCSLNDTLHLHFLVHSIFFCIKTRSLETTIQARKKNRHMIV